MAYTTINKSSEYFNTVTYSGNSSNNRTISGFGFDPDFAWVKCRTSAFSHTLADSVRGTNANLFANETGAEINPTTDIGRGGIGQVTTDGFIAVQGTSSMDNTNTSGQDYVAWSWLAGGTASSNTDGSITSNVSANTTSGFSIVSYSGDGGSSSTVGHGLGVAPKVVIVKDRSSGINQWRVRHESLSSNYNLFLNGTDRAYNMPTETGDGGIGDLDNVNTFDFVSGASNTNAVNTSGNNYIAYCFAEKKGFNKFGSYTGNGNADGTFVYTGFKPAFVIIKKYTVAGYSWATYDSTRYPENKSTIPALWSDLSDAEGSYSTVDFLSNGFKIRDTSPTINNGGEGYIYMCFAESPLVGTNNIPATAR